MKISDSSLVLLPVCTVCYDCYVFLHRELVWFDSNSARLWQRTAVKALKRPSLIRRYSSIEHTTSLYTKVHKPDVKKLLNSISLGYNYQFLIYKSLK